MLNDAPRAAYPKGLASLERYSKPDAVWAALETGTVKLLSAKWLLHKSKVAPSQEQVLTVLARRQELPNEAFLTVKQLKRVYEAAFPKGNPDNLLPIISISFCWLTQAHPDPKGQQLALVAEALEHQMAQYRMADYAFDYTPLHQFMGFEDMGIFWDWASLCQNSVEASRTPAEQKSFDYGLMHTMDLWYAHEGTVVYKLTALPAGSTRKCGYKDSGWTFYEECSSQLIKKTRLYGGDHDKWSLVLDLGKPAGSYEAGRGWPVGPDDFGSLVDAKQFTNGADKGTVKELYRKVSSAVFGGVKELNFTGMPQATVDEAARVGGCLNLCMQLEKLIFQDPSSQMMTDEGFAAMWDRVGGGAMPKLKELRLCGGMGDAGAVALAKWLASSVTLEALFLRYDVGAAGAEAITKASLSTLTTLDLGDKMVDVGAHAIAEALRSGRWPAVHTLYLGPNNPFLKQGGPGLSGLKAVCKERGISAPYVQN